MSNTLLLHEAKGVFEHVMRSRDILVVAHKRPDGDTTGSALALWLWLRSLGKNARVYCVDPIAEHLRYLVGASEVSTDKTIFLQSWDMVLTCDAGDLLIAGIEEQVPFLSARTVVVNFDHHSSNLFFGTYNLVDTSASSTAEVVYRFFELNGVVIDPHIANCLMTAVFTDTMGFTNAATNAKALEMAGHLLAAGASISLIYRANMKNRTSEVLRIWGKAFSRLEKTASGIVYTYLHLHEFGGQDMASSVMQNLSNYLSEIGEALAIFVFHETSDGQVKASFRTTRDDVDLSSLAQKFGGGGHKKAAGFYRQGELLGTIKEVLQEAQTSLS